MACDERSCRSRKMFSFDQSADPRRRKVAWRDDCTDIRNQMTRSADTSKTRELARRLLAYEAVDGKQTMPEVEAVCRVCDKLRSALTTLAGPAGFRSLLTRALTLAKRESPLFAAWEVKSDGSLQVLNGQQAPSGAILVAQLIGLMVTFIGESLTLSLLHDLWPDLRNFEIKFQKDESK
jgi:hypothetical protein